MSVILQGINADIKCIDCPIKDIGDDCLMQKYSYDTFEEMKDDCPMKSVGGLLDKLERIGGNEDKSVYKNLNPSYVQGLKDSIAIIKEYCGMED